MLWELIFYGICGSNFFLVCAACEMGQRSSDLYSNFEKEMIHLDWYLYPIEMQRILIPMTIYAPKSVEIKFFGSISCSREQFKKVINQ